VTQGEAEKKLEKVRVEKVAPVLKKSGIINTSSTKPKT
jgi:hypothetical protein